MKLSYLSGRSPLRHLVLRHGDRRVELHVKAVDEGVWALVALGGDDGGQPRRSRNQGPYQSAGHAEAALRGVAGSLVGQSFEALPSAVPVWSLPAQRQARVIKDARSSSQGDYQFDPSQNEPIW